MFQFFACIITLALSAGAFAAPSSGVRYDVIATKSRIEEVIAKRYRERIATQVPQELFNVSVEADIKLPEVGSNKVMSNTEGLSDLSLGIVESVTSTDLSEIPEEMEIKKIQVSVGLHEKLGAEYEGKFKTWLSSAVKAEFGKFGVAKFSKIAPLPKEGLAPKEPEPPRQLTFEEKFGNYQNALGLGFFSFVLLLGILMLKLLPSKDLKHQMNMAIRIQEMKNSHLQLSHQNQKELLDQQDKEEQLSPNLLFDSLKEHQRKVALIVLSNHELIDQVFDRWSDEAETGRKKIASLVDSLLAQVDPRSHANAIEGGTSINWNLPERIKRDKSLPEVFKSFSHLSLAEKAELTEKAYWDLLSVKTLGDQLTKVPFASMAQLPPHKITKLLSNQDKKIQSVAILHLPQEKMEQVVSEMNFDDKKSVVFQALSTGKINPKDLELADESLRFLVKQEEKQDDRYVEIQNLVPQMLMFLNPIEEIQLIQEITPRLADRGYYLKSSFPSLAFLNEWPEDKLRTLVSSVLPNDVLCLVKTLPELTDVVLSNLPNRTQVIIRDSMNKEPSKDEMIRGLEQVKIKMYNMVNEGQLVLGQIFPERQTVTKVA